jgi:hypothetical protein
MFTAMLVFHITIDMKTHQQRVEWGIKGANERWSKEPPFEKRFWARVDVKSNDECWLWKMSINKKTGYGKSKIHGNHTSAHRVAYEVANGPIPKGVHILHKCDVRRCCNPNHLFPGNRQDNMDDMVNKGRQFRPIGEKHFNRVLDDSKVRQIRELTSNGTSQRDVAKQFGVSHSAVACVCSGKTWAHVK